MSWEPLPKKPKILAPEKVVTRLFPVVHPHLKIPLSSSGSKELWDRIHTKFKPGADFYAEIVMIFDSKIKPTLLDAVREILKMQSIGISFEEFVQQYSAYLENIFNKLAQDVLVDEHKAHFVKQLCYRETFNQALCLRPRCRRG
eukprot:TRINITY_DN126670_c0_g1_i1.p1 TRINITY_DN126670_c0_g1~~TRINITY_DN126670_c0_g1_i1.p1  ORF type:complete len:152 (+),score=12.56 TRINITY_DN126670_c0_g1_i1:26-457(+)